VFRSHVFSEAGMPLHDHFRPPLSERRPWESFHTTWASTLADILNEGVLPPGYIALEQVHSGPALEIDVGTFTGAAAERGVGPSTALAPAVWTPSTAPLLLPAIFASTAAIEIQTTEGGRTLVAAIELVSPANKDRPLSRRLLAAKCAAYLGRGVGLMVMDVVTSRRANLHNEMVELLGLDPQFALAASFELYGVAYRPVTEAGAGRIETWPSALAVGRPLPTMPLSLGAEVCVAVNMEAAYVEACRRRRIEEALV
jgi:hypothetical protein